MSKLVDNACLWQKKLNFSFFKFPIFPYCLLFRLTVKRKGPSHNTTIISKQRPLAHDVGCQSVTTSRESGSLGQKGRSVCNATRCGVLSAVLVTLQVALRSLLIVFAESFSLFCFAACQSLQRHTPFLSYIQITESRKINSLIYCAIASLLLSFPTECKMQNKECQTIPHRYEYQANNCSWFW